MGRSTWFVGYAALAIGCGTDPVPPMATVTDAGMDSGTVSDHPVADTAIPRTDAGFTDTQPMCLMGSYAPCECSPGNLGIHRCIMGTLEAACECDAGAGMDAIGVMPGCPVPQPHPGDGCGMVGTMCTYPCGMYQCAAPGFWHAAPGCM